MGRFILNFRIFLEALRTHFWIVRSASFALFEGQAKAALNAPLMTSTGPANLISLGTIGKSDGSKYSQKIRAPIAVEVNVIAIMGISIILKLLFT